MPERVELESKPVRWSADDRGQIYVAGSTVVVGRVTYSPINPSTSDSRFPRFAADALANAALIAAAPELLAECKEALRWAENRPENWATQLAERLERVIAKAEGRASHA